MTIYRRRNKYLWSFVSFSCILKGRFGVLLFYPYLKDRHDTKLSYPGDYDPVFRLRIPQPS